MYVKACLSMLSVYMWLSAHVSMYECHHVYVIIYIWRLEDSFRFGSHLLWYVVSVIFPLCVYAYCCLCGDILPKKKLPVREKNFNNCVFYSQWSTWIYLVWTTIQNGGHTCVPDLLGRKTTCLGSRSWGWKTWAFDLDFEAGKDTFHLDLIFLFWEPI